LPGASASYGSQRMNRNNLNVDDIEGAVPRRLVGVIKINVKLSFLLVHWVKT